MNRSNLLFAVTLSAALALGCETDGASKAADETASSTADSLTSTAEAAPKDDPKDEPEDDVEPPEPEKETDNTAAPAWASAVEVDENGRAPEESPQCASIEGIDETVGQAPKLEPSEAYESFVASVKAKATAPEKPHEAWRVALPSKTRGKSGREAVRHVQELCASWVGQPVPKASKETGLAGDCQVEFQHEEQVAIVRHIVDCGGDSCSVDIYVWRADAPEPTALKWANDAIEVAPTLDEFFYDRAVNAIDMHTFRSTLDGSATCVVSTECFSPTLSPDGSFLLCRNRKSDLLKVSTAGGKATVVDAADIPKGRTTRIRMQWGVYPSPARFLEDGSVAYDIVTEPEPAGGHESSTKTVKVSLD